MAREDYIMASPARVTSYYRGTSSWTASPVATEPDLQTITSGIQVDWGGITQTPRPWAARTESEKGNYNGSQCNVSFKKRVKTIVGLCECRKPDVWRAAMVEFAATGALTFVTIAAVIACMQGNFSSTTTAIAIVQALIYSLSILVAAPVSGGHINPAITLATFLTGHMSLMPSLLYVLAQTAGAVLGSFFIKCIITTDVYVKFQLGGCLLSQSVQNPSGIDPEVVGFRQEQGFLAEFLFTFTFIFVAYTVGFDPHSLTLKSPVFAPFAIGASLGLLIFVSAGLLPGSGYTGAGMNPARCFGPAVVYGQELWADQSVFWGGPVFAAATVAVMHHLAHEKAARAATPALPLTVFDGGHPCHGPGGRERELAGIAPVERPGTPGVEQAAENRMTVVLHIKAVTHTAAVESVQVEESGTIAAVALEFPQTADEPETPRATAEEYYSISHGHEASER